MDVPRTMGPSHEFSFAAAGETALGRVLDKIYGGSPLKLLTHLVEQRKLSDKELERMRELLNKPAKKKR